MSKPSRSFPRPLSEFTAASLSGALKAQGFASTEILTRWPAIVGAEIAAHSEPMKINWPRPKADVGEVEQAEPATLVLRVEGPMALEIQHQSSVILERVNRFFGWQAVGRLALRQAPLRRKAPKRRPAPPDPAITARLAAEMPEIEDDALRDALARLGTAIKTK
ncbi:MAG TPA: DciA family protein [Pseudolabrys sp.]|nr:DciA family protein [Pseudolabrys sp.]